MLSFFSFFRTFNYSVWLIFFFFLSSKISFFSMIFHIFWCSMKWVFVWSIDRLMAVLNCGNLRWSLITPSLFVWFLFLSIFRDYSVLGCNPNRLGQVFFFFLEILDDWPFFSASSVACKSKITWGGVSFFFFFRNLVLSGSGWRVLIMILMYFLFLLSPIACRNNR